MAKHMACLEAVQRALLFLLVDRVHALLQLRPGGFGLPPGTPFLLDSLEGHTLRLAFLAKTAHFLLQLPGLLLPSIAVGFDLVALRLEISESFFQGRGELLLGVEMFLYSADTRFLILQLLSIDELLASVARSRR